MESRFVITSCDEAFAENPVHKRKEFESLLKKLYVRGKVLFAYDNNHVLGYSAFYANDIDTKNAFISLFAVEPSSQRYRVGTRLMIETFKYAWEKGHQTIALEVSKNNKAALKFYEKNGFLTYNENENSMILRRSLSPDDL